LISCTKDPENDNPSIPSEELFKSGIYIVNEGNFGANNATIDLFVKDSNTLYSNIFNTVNNRPLGDVANSMYIHNNKGYIILNGSASVEVINVNNAVSDWVSNSVKRVNLNTKSITQSIEVGQGPEGMAIYNGKLFVANSGGFSDDSIISVISTVTNEVIAGIIVGDAPTALAFDKNNKLWVLCRGSYGTDFMSTEDDTYAKIVCINPNTYEIEKTFIIGEKGDHPDKMKINKSKDALYYLGSYNFNLGVYKHFISDNALAQNPIRLGYYYGLGYDKVDGELYVADAVDFVQRGYVYKINDSGNILDSFRVGIIPNGIAEQY
jgi:YVTN family beta-propeller protein